MFLRIFIHGLESNNQGTKAVYFRKHFPGMLTPNFPGPLEERMAKLRDILSGQRDIILVGSSYGGLMGSIFTMENEKRVRRLVLLAPAINLTEFSPYQGGRLLLPVHVYHGRQDEVIPLEDVQKVARQVFANLTFRVVDDDHYLRNTFEKIEWPPLLG